MLAISFVFSAPLIFNIREENNTMKEYVGKTYILQKDTFKIIDYSVIMGTYTLNDRTKIDG